MAFTCFRLVSERVVGCCRREKKAIISDGLSHKASPVVEISNQVINDFKKIYELKSVLPVSALNISKLKKENYSYLIR